ncbi:MAG TPA: uroporphyrinogen decarboxylase, partial [Acidimicrobiales bacterium]|nr:uroporphyrinogen decarboxylase [Acidimicrobiales bacterium]
LQPVRRHRVDAAILYSDIVVPVAAIGFGVAVAPGTGPVIEHPFTSSADLRRLRPLEPELDTPYVIETVRILTAELDVPLIGFAGAPFTVASYLVEGGPSRRYARTKGLMYADEPLWHALLDALADLAAASLLAQVRAGAQAVQLFDSWAGALAPADYRRYVMPHSAKVLAAVGELGVPRIHFGIETGDLLGSMAAAGADVVGVDWRTPLDEARRRLPAGVGVQGNLDPVACLCPWEIVRTKAAEVMAANAGRPGHVFNLGHGVLPETDPAVLTRLVDALHGGEL